MPTLFKSLIKLTIKKILCLVLLSVSLLAKSQTGIYVPQLRVYDSLMTNIISKYNLVGGQLAITYEGRLVYNRGFGYADTATDSMVQPNSIFRLASASKAITSIAMMYLFEKGKINLDDKVFGSTGILNDAMYQDITDTRFYDITIRHLLTHSAGFKYVFQTYDIAQDLGVATPIDSVDLLIKWALKNTILDYNPGTSSSYTNFGFVILGEVIEKISGEPYEKFVQNTILNPINITDMHAGRSFYKDKLPREVAYYDYAGAPLSTSIVTGIPNSVPAQYGGYNWEVMTAAGGWVASAKDLCKLLVATDRYTTKPDILLPSTIDTMTKSSKQWPAYGLGWFVGGGDYWHTGGIQGTATVIQRSATQQLNWAILFNALPQNYGPLYNEFMKMVLDKAPGIKNWPIHDLFDASTSIDYAIPLSDMRLYPNPSSTHFTIESNNTPYSIEILDIYGQLVFMGSKPENQKLYTINVSNFKKGIYFVKVITGNTTTYCKIVIN